MACIVPQFKWYTRIAYFPDPPTRVYLVLVLHDHSIKEIILNKLPQAFALGAR
jgi:hypothetical protein